MTLPRNNDEIGSSAYYESIWPSVVGEAEESLIRGGKPCREIAIMTPGVLVVVRPDGGEVIIPEYDVPVKLTIQAIAIRPTSEDEMTNSTATHLFVSW